MSTHPPIPVETINPLYLVSKLGKDDPYANASNKPIKYRTVEGTIESLAKVYKAPEPTSMYPTYVLPPLSEKNILDVDITGVDITNPVFVYLESLDKYIIYPRNETSYSDSKGLYPHVLFSLDDDAWFSNKMTAVGYAGVTSKDMNIGDVFACYRNHICLFSTTIPVGDLTKLKIFTYGGTSYNASDVKKIKVIVKVPLL